MAVRKTNGGHSPFEWPQREISAANLAGEIFNEFHQTAQSDSRRALVNPWFLFLNPCGAGDIEMNPRSIFGKFLEEHGGVDGSAPASAGVDDVGDARFDVLFIFVVERQPPHFFAGLFVGLMEALIDSVVVRENASIGISEYHPHRYRERGGIHQMRAAKLARVVEAVSQDQSSFRVGIDDLDGF